MAGLATWTRRMPVPAPASRAGDFNDELYDALKGSKSEFSGSFYHCSTAANAPNPGLKIEGVGSVGLPLSERDAAAIISCAAQAPFGKGTETVVDTTVRDTWEVEPGIVSFLNPKWTAFVDEVATKTVWTALGVAPFATRPRCELYKLLLYQPGGHFLAHQDTLKSNGMFATIVIVLPSAFEGGEVHVSHAGQTKVLDVSQDSHFATTILAWYTDVLHEVKPVTSGYRLALSYNLIHTSPNMPLPALPEGGILSTTLGLCLQKWKNGGFTTMPSTPLAAYLLDHEYSTNDLDQRQERLKGKDAKMVSQLLPIAERLGFVVGLANITRHITGSADDYGENDYRHNKRARHGREVYDSTQPQARHTYNFADIQEDNYKLVHFVRVDEGEPRKGVGLDDFTPDKSCFVPKNPFSGVAPHREEYEGYMGNWAGTLEQWYRRSVLVLFRAEDFISVGITANGMDWALTQLEDLKRFEDRNNPTAKFLVRSLLAKIERPIEINPRPLHYKEVKEARDFDAERRCAQSLLDCAVRWKHQALWSRVIPHCGPALETAGTSIAEALEVFDLDSIKPCLALLVQQSVGLHTRFAVIDAISNKVGTTETEWLESLTQDALSEYRDASIADIPTLIRIAETRGADVIETRILPQIAEKGTYDFLTALARALNDHRSTQSSGERAALTSAICQCVFAASRQCPHDPQSGQLIDLVDLCFAIEEPTLCVSVLNLVRQESTGPALTDFAKTVHKNLADTPGMTDGTRGTLTNVVRKAMQGAISKWEVGLRILVPYQPINYAMMFGRPVRALLGPGPSTPKPDPRLPNVKSNRICELVKLIFSLDQRTLFPTLLDTLLQLPPNIDLETRFKEVYIPLMPQLKATLAEHAIAVATEPFASFFKHIISLYLAGVLAPLTPRTLLPSLPTIDAGCGACTECKQLRDFVNDGSPELRFRAVRDIRTHLETEIDDADVWDRVWTETITDQGTPYTLVVSKRPEVVGQLAWKATQGDATLFLSSVGGDAELRDVMGEKYQQVLWALHGHRAFPMPRHAEALSVVPAATTSHSGLLSVTPSRPTSARSTATASSSSGVAPSSCLPTTTKRKQRETIDVIDLT